MNIARNIKDCVSSVGMLRARILGLIPKVRWCQKGCLMTYIVERKRFLHLSSNASEDFGTVWRVSIAWRIRTQGLTNGG
jgi:hypothetical protein